MRSRLLTPTVHEWLAEGLATGEWADDDLDGEPLVECEFGGLVLSVYTERSPVEWHVIMLALDGAGVECQRQGHADSIEEAKVAARNEAHLLVEAGIREILECSVDPKSVQ